jgi:LmbE family N-acetylglucosaminyl deacetylase
VTGPPPGGEGGLAAVLAHPDDESITCAGALALAHDEGRPVRLLVVTQGEAGTPDGNVDPSLAQRRMGELRCAAEAIGIDEVTVMEGFPDGGVAEQPFESLVAEVAAWLRSRRPNAVITFGSHGITGNRDHMVVGSATRWAVEQLAESGLGPNAVYVVAPAFHPAANRFDLSAEEQGASHRIEITGVAERKATALECHASQRDIADEIAIVRGALAAGDPIYEGYRRVRPEVEPPHPTFDTRLL